jgi:hypothetical protein
MVLSAAQLRRLTAFRVSKYLQTDTGSVSVEFFPPLPAAPAAPAKTDDEPATPTPDQWLRTQYEKPDGT